MFSTFSYSLNVQNENANTKPTHNLRKRVGYGKQANFETIGVAWKREDGGFYVKLYGTQVIDSGFYAFPIPEQTANESDQ